MTRRLVTGALVLALVAGACGLGDKQAQTDRIIHAGEKLMATSSLTASIGVQVRVLPVDRVLVVQEPPRIAAGALPPEPTVIRPAQNAASVAGVLLFIDGVVYERIAPRAAAAGSALASVPSNLNSIVAAKTGEAVRPTAAVGDTASTTSTTSTTAVRTLRRSVQIVRQWAAFDFAEIPDHDRTKHGGSLAVNPVALLRLTTGVLTGSVERHGSTYLANVSRDKAERKLSEDDREVLDKMFTANAITRRVFPAKFVFGDDGALASFQVKLRQQLSSKDRADLTVTLGFAPAHHGGAIDAPPRRGTVNVNSLGELVTTVSGL